MRDSPLDKPIQFLKGVGPVRAEQFARLGIQSVGDLLEHLPSRYELIPKSVAIGSLELDSTATVIGSVRRMQRRRGMRGGYLIVDLEDATGVCRLRWFNAPYMHDKLREGDVLKISGRVEADDRRAIFSNPRWELIPDGVDPFAEDRDEYAAVYPATGQMNSATVGRIVSAALAECAEAIPETLPGALREKRELAGRRAALNCCHSPADPAHVEPARRRLAYEELLAMQLAIQIRRQASDEVRGAPKVVTTKKVDERIRARLPFTLTPGQDKAVQRICADLAEDRPMQRLLQGDVGSGKTAVAVYAALTTVANRLQVAILAPTEILARQSHARVQQYLAGSKVRVALLVGAMPRERRNDVCRRLQRGEIDLVVGTHALLEEDVRFRRLGLVIVDEQHRFGVEQRQALRTKAAAPHYLVMTATPIPRTLAMTFYSDLDVTTIEGLPPGRRPVITRLVEARDARSAWAFVRERLAAGEQSYIVYPLIEESESLDLKAAQTQSEVLARDALKGFRVGLLHGRMKQAEKEQTIGAFREGKIQALVSTTVIEVGVDVPNATVMVIEHAERFGLAQLHQLRGRVGRGGKQSYCILMPATLGETSRSRLDVLCSTQDGFAIAEADLLQRGPGEFLGTRQHGVPLFRIARLAEDVDLLVQARDDAAELLRDDAFWHSAEAPGLVEAVVRRYPDCAPGLRAGRGQASRSNRRHSRSNSTVHQSDAVPTRR